MDYTFDQMPRWRHASLYSLYKSLLFVIMSNSETEFFSSFVSMFYWKKGQLNLLNKYLYCSCDFVMFVFKEYGLLSFKVENE